MIRIYQNYMIIALTVIAGVVFPTVLQAEETAQMLEEERLRAVYAMSLGDYLVTPGDSYTLSYRVGTEAISATVLVERDYRINLGAFGVISAEGLTFPELRQRVESLVVDSYPRSTPRLVIRSLGRFQVTVTGEVERVGLSRVDGLTRLESVARGRATEYASMRTVTVRRADGTRTTYDLFRFERDGEVSQNPYLRPDDRIELLRAPRTVRVSGEVHRPGTYQLLPGENLRELIERYGGGLTAAGDPERVRIQRIPPNLRATSRSYEVRLDTSGPETSADQELQDQDRVTVRTKDQFLPVVFFEGAIFAGEEREFEVREGVDAPASGYARYSHRYRPGDTLADAVRSISNRLLPASDMAGAYLTRSMASGGEIIELDLEELIYQRDPEVNPELQPGDRIMIPFRQRFVTVTGGVHAPGRIAYVPGRTYDYYLAQAGGVNPNRHMGERPRIYTIDGERRNRRDEIRPEDRIHFSTNSPIFYLGPVTTVLSLITSTVSMILLLQ